MTNLIKCSKCGATNRVQVGVKQTAICGRCKKSLSGESKPIIVTDANFNVEVVNSKLPVLLDLWAEWCPPCRMLAPIIEEVALELAGKVCVGKLDVDKNPISASRFQARSIPTLVILKDGQELDRMIGLQSKEAILRRVLTHL